MESVPRRRRIGLPWIGARPVSHMHTFDLEGHREGLLREGPRQLAGLVHVIPDPYLLNFSNLMKDLQIRLRTSGRFCEMLTKSTCGSTKCIKRVWLLQTVNYHDTAFCDVTRSALLKLAADAFRSTNQVVVFSVYYLESNWSYQSPVSSM